MKPVLTLIASLLAVSVSAQEPSRPAGFAPLEKLFGMWTIAGKESTYVETCAWFHGKRHMVCNTATTRPDGVLRG